MWKHDKLEDRAKSSGRRLNLVEMCRVDGTRWVTDRGRYRSTVGDRFGGRTCAEDNS
jgi:hypothetical protein